MRRGTLFTGWMYSMRNKHMIISLPDFLFCIFDIYYETLLLLQPSLCPIKHDTNVYYLPWSLFRKPEKKMMIQKYNMGNKSFFDGLLVADKPMCCLSSFTLNLLKVQNALLLVLESLSPPPLPPPQRLLLRAEQLENVLRILPTLWTKKPFRRKCPWKIQFLEKHARCISLKYFVILMSDFSNFTVKTGPFIPAFKNSIRWPQLILIFLLIHLFFLAVTSFEVLSSNLLMSFASPVHGS